ncbi:hypothetical protein ACPPVS_13765 [Cellulomonas sp. McL0617]|uniref:hypothetical protein n=1 Tax=Cellulomonas sp. McL0617 TaxID=3415675 RepID=UPI003CE67D1A
MRRSLATAGVAAVLLPLTLGAASAPAAAADSGDVAVTNTETVQAKLDATGTLVEARVYDQLALSGHGTATIRNPVSTKGLRNLDGFTGFQVVDGSLVSHVTVDGERRQRSVSDYDKDLPLTVKVSYTLDGKPVDPGNVVGRTGTLGVHYVVTNTTRRTQDVTYDDGTGTRTTASAQTVVPMIGQLVTTLPASFTDVSSDEAGAAGDGHGGTRLTFQMTLFPPIGSDTAEFGYTAHVAHGLVPPANLTSMAVSPLDYPSFKDGSASYQAGAQKGVDLTAGALQIDASVLKLHDGSAQLLAGLLQLHDGATQLSSGLNDDAAPGAAALAVGARTLDAGLSEARSKAPQLIAGLGQVDHGLAQVDAGLTKMYGDVGTLPAQAKPLHDGIARVRGAIGSTTTAGTLLFGVDQARQGAAHASAVNAQMADGAKALSTQLAGALTTLGGYAASMPNVADQQAYLDSLSGLGATAGTALATLAGTATAVSTGLGSGPTGLTAGLGAVECGLSRASLGGCPQDGLLEGVAQVDAGVTTLVAGVVSAVQKGVGDGDDTRADGTLRGGVHSLQAGTDQLSDGGDALADGLGRLGTGAHQLSAGAGQLSDGLRDAAAGSTQLADGLGDAAAGAPALVDGTQQLSDEGTSQVVANGEQTAADFGVKYAVLAAGAQRAADESMAYGAPAGATGATAYSIDIAGADGSGVHALARLVVAIVLFAAGIGVASLVRRRIG